MKGKQRPSAFIKDIYQIGVKSSQSRLEKGRILLLNAMVLLGVMVCLILTIITIFQGLFPQPLFTLLGTFLFLFNYYLISKGWHGWARNYYIIVGSAIVIFVCLSAYPQGLFTETENIILAFMANCILLFGRKKGTIGYWTLYLILITLKVIREDYRGSEADLHLMLLIQNTSILTVLLFLFLRYFKNTLLKSLQDTISSEQNLYDTIDNISQFIALLNPDGTYRIVNKHYERAFNIPREKIIGKTPFDVMPLLYAERQSAVVAEAVEKKQRMDFKVAKEMEDGTLNVGQGKVTPILNEKGEVVALAGYVTNISELEKTKRELTQANQSKDKIFSIVTHDLKSPLNMFESMLDAAHDHVLTAENFTPFVDQLQAKFNPIKETVTDLLKWSKSNLSEMDIDAEPFDSSTVIQEVEALSKLVAEEKGISIVSNDPSQRIKMDSGHFKIAIRNILQNAIKFSPLNGTIEINQKREGDFVEISIRDEGKGISDEVKENILNGMTVNPGQGTKGELGSGIGLTLVTGLLAKNQCELKIENHHGTMMVIRIPAG